MKDHNAHAQQLGEARADLDAQSKKLNGLTNELRSRNEEVQDTKTVIENLELRKQDAHGSIDNL
jgi:uncharacterized coiled-coil protein SlyX